MTLESSGAPLQVSGYAARSREYLSNAYLSLERDELEKAGEFLWGSMAQAIKAVAASVGIQLRSHGDVWRYVTVLSRELDYPGILEAFRDANSLHQNFYESGLTRDIILNSGEGITTAVGRLLALIPREALDR